MYSSIESIHCKKISRLCTVVGLMRGWGCCETMCVCVYVLQSAAGARHHQLQKKNLCLISRFLDSSWNKRQCRLNCLNLSWFWVCSFVFPVLFCRSSCVFLLPAFVFTCQFLILFHRDLFHVSLVSSSDFVYWTFLDHFGFLNSLYFCLDYEQPLVVFVFASLPKLFMFVHTPPCLHSGPLIERTCDTHISLFGIRCYLCSNIIYV